MSVHLKQSYLPENDMQVRGVLTRIGRSLVALWARRLPEGHVLAVHWRRLMFRKIAPPLRNRR